METALSRIAAGALDLLFPLHCAVCSREGQILCQACEPTLPRLERPYRSICAEPGSALLCERCATTTLAIDGTRAPYLFDGAVRDMVHNLKYRNLRASSPDLGRLMSAYLEANPVPADVLVPVPLHKRAERTRGYNQSEFLARQVSKRTGIPLEPNLLHRTRNTPPQVSMESYEERRENIAGAFECRRDVGGRSVVVIDDVVTTGSTVSACASALKAAGAAAVWALAIARQP